MPDLIQLNKSNGLPSLFTVPKQKASPPLTNEQKSLLRCERDEAQQKINQINYVLNIEPNFDKRKASGKLANKISAYTLSEVIRHYFDGDRGVVLKSFNAIYTANTHVDKHKHGMEVDWADKMSRRSYKLNVLTEAIEILQDSGYKPILTLLSAKTFKARALTALSSLTAGIKHMNIIISQELELVAKDEELISKGLRIMELEAQIAVYHAANWEAHARTLLSEGKKHTEVARLTGKSTKSIQRLVKKDKS